MKQLWVIRHGQPDEGHAAAPHDPPLLPDGRRHARRLAHRLKPVGIERIVSSPQQRALQTAAPLARLLSLDVEVHNGLAEVDHRGGGRYRSVETLRREEPQRWAEFMASPARFFGHDPAAFRATVVAAYRDILESERGTRIAVFSHGMTTKTLLSAVLGLPEALYAQFTIGYCSVTRLSGPAWGELRVDSVNESLGAGVARRR